MSAIRDYHAGRLGVIPAEYYHISKVHGTGSVEQGGDVPELRV
ncbi:MAG: hypothetical protein WD557_20065 [Dehalococcoidia bacterium]